MCGSIGSDSGRGPGASVVVYSIPGSSSVHLRSGAARGAALDARTLNRVGNPRRALRTRIVASVTPERRAKKTGVSREARRRLMRQPLAKLKTPAGGAYETEKLST